MENQPVRQPDAPKMIFTFGQQFLVFLIVLNLWALYALADLYWKAERTQKALERQQTDLLRDSLRREIILDSIRLAHPAPADSLNQAVSGTRL